MLATVLTPSDPYSILVVAIPSTALALAVRRTARLMPRCVPAFDDATN